LLWERQKKTLNENLSNFCDYLDVSGVVPHLKARGIIQWNQLEEIEAKTTTSKKVTLLMNYIEKKLSEGYDAFYEVLLKTEQTYLAKLLEADRTPETAIKEEDRQFYCETNLR